MYYPDNKCTFAPVLQLAFPSQVFPQQVSTIQIPQNSLSPVSTFPCQPLLFPLQKQMFSLNSYPLVPSQPNVQISSQNYMHLGNAASYGAVSYIQPVMGTPDQCSAVHFSSFLNKIPVQPSSGTVDERCRKQLIVNYLAPDITAQDLHTLFSPFGLLDGTRIIYDKQTCVPRGYGFVYFHYPEDAKKAVETMNGFLYHGKRLKISYSNNPLDITVAHPTVQNTSGQNTTI